MLELTEIRVERGPTVVLDSATWVRAEHQGAVVVSGSHGGIYPAHRVALCGARGAVFNDAGLGRDHAGTAGLDFLNALGVPAAAVGCDSARIGYGADTKDGMVSRVNETAARLGAEPGMTGADASLVMSTAAPVRAIVPPGEEGRHTLGENITGVDSASLISAEDQGHFVVTGSHGGLIGGRPENAINNRAVAGALFNDAGIGRDHAGLSRLWVLNEWGVPAATVGYQSARIGDAASTYADGVVSALNHTAAVLGAEVDMPAAGFVEVVLARHVSGFVRPGAE